MSTEIARIEDALRLSDTITKAINSNIEELIDMNLSTISKELSRKFEELRVLTQVLLDKRREMLSNLRDQKAKRDELNQKVKEVAQIIRQLRERRNELQKFITEKRKEAQEIKDEISKIQENMSLLEKELKGYDHRRTKKLEGEIKRLEWVLQTQTLPDPIEKRLTERIMRLSNTLKELKTAEDHDLQTFLVDVESYKYFDETNIRQLKAIRRFLQEGASNDIVKYMLPEAYKTSLVWTINMRSLQNFLRLRTSTAALPEIRELAWAIVEAMPEQHKYLLEESLI